MKHLVSILDAAFKGRAVAPSKCISFCSDPYLLVQDNRETDICVFVIPGDLTQEEIAQNYFSVHNDHLKNVSLWAVDGCFMSPGVGSRCDCILFTEEEFCFVEFKLEAQTIHPKSILEHRKKASNQLRSTIILVFGALTARRLSLGNIQFEAYICSPPKFPSKDTSLPDERIEFLETYGVMLFEESEKHFS
ncbi:MAG: hypothetical protein ACKV1O_17525 [Saprospiraceae bacterium]